MNEKKCKYCMSDIDINAVICPNCRKKQGKTKKCWKCKQKVLSDTKICPHCETKLTVPKWAVALFIFVVVGIIAIASQIDMGNSNIMKEMGVSKEQATEIEKVFKEVGINNVGSIAYDEGLDDENGKGYRVAYNGIDTNDVNKTVIVYINSDNKVQLIRYPMGANLYENGKVLGNIMDNNMTLDEQSDYQYFAEQEIKKLLKSPSTAKFPSITEWKFNKKDGAVTLQAYVDSQNSYGATVRGEFQFKFDKDKNVTSLIFEGKEYMK